MARFLHCSMHIKFYIDSFLNIYLFILKIELATLLELLFI